MERQQNKPPIQTRSDLSAKLGAKAEGKNLPTETGKNLPAENKDYSIFSDFMERHKRDFEMVIPSHLKPERVMRLAISACRRNPELLTCDLQTVVGGLLEASSLGLEVNSPMRHASLIPFRNNKSRKKEAQLIIEYRGLVELMLRHPKVISVFGNVVYSRDVFTVQYGTNEKLEHIELEEADRGEIRGFYAYCRMTEDAYRFVYLSKAKVDGIRDKYSAGYKNAKSAGAPTPWVDNYEEMGIKTAIRRLERFVPKSPELSRGIEADFKVVDPFDPNFVPPEQVDTGEDK